jgi:hypothetical protein
MRISAEAVSSFYGNAAMTRSARMTRVLVANPNVQFEAQHHSSQLVGRNKRSALRHLICGAAIDGLRIGLETAQ